MQKRLALISLILVWVLTVMLPPVANLCADSGTVQITAIPGEEESGESLEIDFFETQIILSSSDSIILGFDINDPLLTCGYQPAFFEIYRDIQVPPPKA